MFSEDDIKQIKTKGLELNDVNKQIIQFEKGFPSLNLKSSAIIKNGIQKFDSLELNKYEGIYNDAINNISTTKFVPASGAATRMFKDLYDYLSGEDKQMSVQMVKFFSELDKFAFYDDLKEILTRNNLSIEKLLEVKKHSTIIEYILEEKGLNYAKLPKGMLKFHKYTKGARTSFEEHLIEALNYSTDKRSTANIHFTVSQEHTQLFEEKYSQVKNNIENEFNTELNISFSTQKSSTDTIAVKPTNEAFRNNNAQLVFRPGGHGALIENLNQLDNDIVFIKNIDNVVPDKLKIDTYKYKKALAGKLLDVQKYIFSSVKNIKNNTADNNSLEGMLKFSTKELCILPPQDLCLKEDTEIKKYILNIFDRPIRVCGMVKNEGEPGGGPFFSTNQDGTTSLQIVEGAQIDKDNKMQAEILNSSSHFNPVDLVCGLRNYKAEKFDLKNYIDYNTGFISAKSLNGKQLKAMELPGLWNGAMSNWNTIFVEVPVITFNPVKTIFDLLREEHRN